MRENRDRLKCRMEKDGLFEAIDGHNFFGADCFYEFHVVECKNKKRDGTNDVDIIIQV